MPNVNHRIFRSVVITIAVVWMVVTPNATRADSPYQVDEPGEYAWLAGGLGLCLGGWIATAGVDGLTDEQIAALDRNDINSLDRHTMQPYRKDHGGDAMAFASFLLPLGLLGMPNARDDSGALGLMWLEANAWSQGLCTVTKVIAQRTRPYVYDPDAPADKKTRPNARLSYFSGHTVAAATNSFFVATVFSDYSSNHSAEVAVWSSAVLYSALTGFFRVDSGHHFTTDVLTGFAIGATAGYLVPRFHRRNHDDVSVNPGSPGAALGVTVTFAF